MTTPMTPEELLNMAKGVTPEGQKMKSHQDLINYFLQPFTNSSSDMKKFITRRREFRRTMFAVRKKLHYNQTEFTPEELAVKEIIDQRLNPNRGLTWAQFTFLWDVSPNPETPAKIIQKNEWFKEGGQVDNDVGSFYPSAFTEQGV